MCGIIAYLGRNDAIGTVISGLETLEYRGYDSAGLAYITNNTIETIKSVGTVAALSKKVARTTPPHVNLAIGHTRWATHGGVTEANSHPHVSHDGTVAVVHNGIIENYAELKKDLETRGTKFVSETDTEVIPNLIAENMNDPAINGDFFRAVTTAARKLTGGFAFIAMKRDSNEIIAVKNGTQPLVIGKTEGGVYVSSDTPTATAKCRTIYALEDGEAAKITAEGFTFFNLDGDKITKRPLKLSAKPKPVDRGPFATFMEKEIREIPAVLAEIERTYATMDLTRVTNRISKCDAIHIAACGTSYHAGLYIGHLFAARNKRVCVHLASELPFARPYIGANDMAIVISQSGETADTIEAMKVFKSTGLFTIGICNVEGSSIWRYADAALPTLAGVEVAVASTKAFLAQVMVGEILAKSLTASRPSGGDSPFNERGGTPSGVTGYVHAAQNIINQADEIKSIAKRYKDIAHIFFLGRGAGYVTALEAALKVKEITYRHCEGIAAGELKHGTLAMVDAQTLSIIITPTDPEAAKKIENAAHEVRARGSNVWVIPPATSAISVIYAQLFALYLCEELNLDPDKPRNLAKSVTVG